ncbi:hypothetical protein CDV26_01605 [Francisella halioticida]|uniref:PNPLA domain-containing protein n=1 Tax=Francisella halioticida TaxID=549298 RepID=A0ABM6LX81_9GAMM|nr:patatin-like phospholipase family protein [Francisella halioticida]ASG67256.1 hypothetical protein CDV26_01605 [Francisella halioticida]
MKVLCIDGGGVKGIIPAQILYCIEKDFRINIQDHFQLVSATSTGALIAIQMNIMKKSAKEILDTYTDHSLLSKVFHKNILSFLSSIYGSTFSGESKYKALIKMLGTSQFSTAIMPTLITSYNLTKNKAVLFKSTAMTQNLTSAQVGNASSSAPTYFPPFKINNNYYIDGGVTANNPSMLGVAYAVELGSKLDDISILSLGTGYSAKDNKAIKKRLSSVYKWGGLSWLANGIIDDFMNGDTNSSTYSVDMIMSENKHLRINPDLGMASSDMSDISEDNIKELVKVGLDTYSENKANIKKWLQV